MKYVSLVPSIICVILLLSFSSCTRYVCWLEDVFDQGTFLECYCDLVEQYVRHARVYDQFTTLGLFDALWLHDEVRTAYAKVYACKRGFDQERYHQFLRRQLQENKHFITFYILAAIPSYDGVVLGDKDAMWSVHLCVDGVAYLPIEVKITELTPEYRRFFGRTYSRFKIPYVVRFNATDFDNFPIIRSGTRCITLIFRRIGRETTMQWALDAQLKVIRCKDWDPDILAYDINDNI